MVEKEITRVEKGGKKGLKESKGRCLENLFAKHVSRDNFKKWMWGPGKGIISLYVKWLQRKQIWPKLWIALGTHQKGPCFS